MKSAAILAAKEAGKILMRNFGKKLKFRSKGKEGLVSEVDIACDKKIKEIISKKYPDHNFVTEESPPTNKKSEYTWYIDPLDGTHNYLHGIPLFGVSIALEKNKQIVLGVIYLPYYDELFVAEKGKGAYCNGKRIRVSINDNVFNSFVVVSAMFRHTREKGIALLKKISGTVYDIRMYGCAVFHLLLVAKGNIDAYLITTTTPWDISAGLLLVSEAGGSYTDWKGKQVNHLSTEFLISNGKIHNQLLKLLR